MKRLRPQWLRYDYIHEKLHIYNKEILYPLYNLGETTQIINFAFELNRLWVDFIHIINETIFVPENYDIKVVLHIN